MLLAELAAQNSTLSDLAVQADTVLHDLSDNRTDVQRFVVDANNISVDSASRKTAISAGFALLPHFLAELKPAMASLGNVATNFTPALENLNASANQLTNLFHNIGPFANASTPAIAALGRSSVTGNQAVIAAKPTIAQLNTFAQGTPELAQNLAIVLQHLDNPAYGADHDARAVPQHPTTHSDTYTGLEALLQYVFDQANNTNGYTADGHQLALATIADPTTCSPYADPAAANKFPQCHAWLGPTQPGVTTPDPTKYVATANNPGAGSSPSNPLPGAPSPPSLPSVPALSTRASTQTCVVGICLPTTTPQVTVPAGTAGTSVSAVGTSGATGATGAAGSAASGPSQTGEQFLNYLLGP